MTTSQAANAALIRSLQRVRERQARVAVTNSSPQIQMHPSDNISTVHTITPEGSERRGRNQVEQPTPRPQWNSSNVYQPTKIPRSVFADGNRPVENLAPRQMAPSGSPNRSLHSPEVTSSVKVVRVPSTTVEEPYRTAPVYVQQSYQPNTRLIRTDPEVVYLDSHRPKRSFFDRFRRQKTHRTNYYSERDILLNPSQSSVYRCCQCCARGRLASCCPSCYFCELFYGCPLYCWLLTLLLLLLPMLALFGWFLSEQPAINPARRRYVTQQSSIVQNDVYAVMRNCAVPYCTNTSPATTINQLYLTYHDYSATQVTSNGSYLQTYSLVYLVFFYIVMKLWKRFH